MPQEVTSNLSAPTRIRNRISRTQEKGTKSRSLPALSTTEPAPGSILISNKRLLPTTKYRFECPGGRGLMDDEFNYKKEHSRSKHSIDRLLDGTKSWCPREPQRWRYAAKELSTSNLSAPTRIRYRISRTQEKGTKSRSLPALSTTEPAPGSILVSNKRSLPPTKEAIRMSWCREGRWTLTGR
jgi:hypothetical protein